MSRPVSEDLLSERTPIAGLVAFFSGKKKAGSWELPRHMRVVAVCGGAELDLREAVIAPGVSLIETLTVMGGIEITVPPTIRVECEGDAIMGSFELHRSRKGPALLPPPPGAPVVRVTGDAYMGGVTVRVKALRERSLAQRARELLQP